MTRSRPDQWRRALTLRVDELGLGRLTWTVGTVITGELARTAMDLFAEASGDRSIPLLVDITGTPSLTRDARIAFSQRCSASRVAVLGNAPTHQVMASFLEVVTTFPVPVRYFTSERAAVKWLYDGAS